MASDPNSIGEDHHTGPGADPRDLLTLLHMGKARLLRNRLPSGLAELRAFKRAELDDLPVKRGMFDWKNDDGGVFAY